MDAEPLLVGVDGGGTHCRARVVTLDGRLIGEARGGRANIHSDFDGALSMAVATVTDALHHGGFGAESLGRCHAGLGLAGANMPSAKAAFALASLPFAAHSLASDAVTACLGAHAGEDGGLAILGTGSAYVLRKGEAFTLFGGWGLAVSDHGSGADLGRAALAASLLAYDGVKPASGLTADVLRRFSGDPAELAAFAAGAVPRDFGGFAPMVFDHADRDDPIALDIVARALEVVEASLDRLAALGAERITLTGGAASRYLSRLSALSLSRIVEAKGDALDGAIVLARDTLPQ